jgi:hypothetical protein
MSRAAQKTLSTENLKQLLSSEDISVTFPKQNEKNLASKFWYHLNRIFVYNKKKDYIFCESCMLLITYKHATGIESMQKHIASCSQKPCSVDGLNEKKNYIVF